MKILFIDQFSEMGGAQHGLIETMQTAQRRGWEAHVAVPGDGPLVDQIRSLRLPATGLPCGPYHARRKRTGDVFQFARDLPKQMRIIRTLWHQERFDLLYVNGPRLLPAAALACPESVPVLFHAHSHICQAAVAKFVRWSIRKADATVVACSNSVAESLADSVGSGKLHVIPNGVPEVAFRERPFGRERSWRIGMVARISPEKGQAEFLQAAALLAREFNNARFVICGAPLFPDTGYADLVRSLSKDLPVEFLGWREDVGAVFAVLDLLVVPSSEEGMGRVIVEAFSAGVPVLAFPTGGIPEVVADGETGFLTKGTSSEELANRVREVMATCPKDLRRITASAREAWERSYTLDRYQERITTVMETLVSPSQAKHETGTLPARR